MGRKLLAMDLDGTAVRDDYSMGELTRKSIEDAKDAGHIIAFVSGRREIDMLTMSEEEAGCADYQILNNGGKILRCDDHSVLYNRLIAPGPCRKLIQYCLDRDLQLQICSCRTWQVTVMTEHTMEYAEEVGVIPKVVRSLEEAEWREGLEGFMATRDLEAIGKYIDEALPAMYYVSSEPGCIDIMSVGATKWNGVKKLADQLNIPRDDIITIGNYYNDIDMLKYAGVGIAVANSLPAVKEEADYITKNDNNHDAVAEIVEKMLAGGFEIGAVKGGKESESCGDR